MIHAISAFAYLLLFVIGLFIGRIIFKSFKLYFNVILIILIILLTWTFKSSYLIKIFEFEFMLSPSLQTILLGLLIGRLISDRSRSVKYNI